MLRGEPVAVVLACLFCVAGCPRGPAPSADADASPRPLPAKEILELDAADPRTEPELVRLVASDEAAEMRYLALRKLEEIRSPRTVEAASGLLQRLHGDPSKDARFLETNAVAVLHRAQVAGDEAARVALDVRRADPRIGALVALLEKKEGAR